MTAVGRAPVDAPTKQPLPAGEQTAPSSEQPTPAAKHEPYGADVEEAAELLVARVRADTAGQEPLDRYESTTWWRLVHLRTAELLHDVVRGEPLAELADNHTYRQIEQRLTEQGTRVSDSTITKLIRAWKQWRGVTAQR